MIFMRNGIRFRVVNPWPSGREDRVLPVSAYLLTLESWRVHARHWIRRTFPTRACRQMVLPLRHP